MKIPLAVTGGFRSLQGMADAISSGAIDFVGLARSLAIEPDVPNRLLSGQEPRLRVRPIKTGLPPIDRMGLMEITWYTGQLKRIGRGEPPKPDEMPLWVFLKYIAKQAGLGRKKAPSRLRAN